MIKKLGILLAAMALSVTMASAITIADLNDGSGMLTEGDKTFFDFAVFGSSSITGQIADIEDFTNVITTNVGGLIGLTFNALPYAAAPGEVLDITIQYAVAVDDLANFLIVGIGQGMTVNFPLSGFGDGSIILTEEVFDNAGRLGDPVARSTVGADANTVDTADAPAEALQFDDLTLIPGLKEIWITKDLQIVGKSLRSQGTGSIGVSVITQNFPQEGGAEVPEPATMLLFSTALLGLGYLRRKKS